MDSFILIVYIIFHVVCGLIAAGIFCAFAQSNLYLYDRIGLDMSESYYEDLATSLIFGFWGGPIALLFSFCFTGNGCSLKRHLNSIMPHGKDC